jgi:hypothetical protein
VWDVVRGCLYFVAIAATVVLAWASLWGVVLLLAQRGSP